MLKDKNSKHSFLSPRDTLPFVKCSSAAEILDTDASHKQNRENQPLRSKPLEQRQDTQISDRYESYSTHMGRRKNQAHRQTLHPTQTPNIHNATLNPQRNLTIFQQQQIKVMTKLLKQTKAELVDRMRQDHSDLKSQIESVKKNYEQFEKKSSSNHKKLSETCSMMKDEYRRIFTSLMEQLNKKFISLDRNMLQLGEQTMIGKSTLELIKEQFSKKLEDVNMSHCSLINQINNYAKVDRLEESDYDVSLDIGKREEDTPDTNEKQIQLSRIQEQILSIKEELAKITTPVPHVADPNVESLRSQIIQSISRENQETSKNFEPQLQQYDKTLKQLTDNINKINHEFQRVVNECINPRLAKLETVKHEQCKKATQDVTKALCELQEKLKDSRVLRARRLTSKETRPIQLLKEVDLGDTYVIDEEGYLMDCDGVYLAAEDGERIKIQENQINFLSLGGLQVKTM